MNLQQSRDSECGDATYHNPNKKVVVSQVLLQPSGSHSRNHHAKRHKSGTDGIVCRLVLAVGKVNEVEHVGCESETVSELFDEDANVDKKIISQILNNYDRETTNFYRWKVRYTQEELAELIRLNTKTDYGSILDLIPVRRGKSGRICK